MTPKKKYNSVEEMVDSLSGSDEFKRSFRLTVQNKILIRGLDKIITEADKCGRLMEDNQPSQRDLMSMAIETLKEAGAINDEPSKDPITDLQHVTDSLTDKERADMFELLARDKGPSEDDIKWIKETDKGVKRYFSAQNDPSTIQTDDKEAEVFRRLRMAVSKLKKIYGIE